MLKSYVVIFLTAKVIPSLLIKDTFFYLGIMAAIKHANLWQQLLFIVYLFKIKLYPLCKMICIQYNVISKTRKITHRGM